MMLDFGMGKVEFGFCKENQDALLSLAPGNSKLIAIVLSFREVARTLSKKRDPV